MEYIINSIQEKDEIHEHIMEKSGIAFVSISFFKKDCPVSGFIYDFDVKENYRRNGVGSEILTVAENVLAMMGAKVIRLIVYFNRENTSTLPYSNRLVSFYEKRGYKQESEDEDGKHMMKKSYGKLIDILIYFASVPLLLLCM